jgi:cell division initiation protein
VTEEIKKSADKEADIIIGRAELEAERIQEQAVQRRSDLLLEIAELKRQRAQFMAMLRGMLNTHAKLLDVAEDDTSQKVEENLAVMRRPPHREQARSPSPVTTPPLEDPTRVRNG